MADMHATYSPVGLNAGLPLFITLTIEALLPNHFRGALWAFLLT